MSTETQASRWRIPGLIDRLMSLPKGTDPRDVARILIEIDRRIEYESSTKGFYASFIDTSPLIVYPNSNFFGKESKYFGLYNPHWKPI